ncbi:Urb1p SCDLUD_003080 [Saccharomycodes ludwigii]|uniref:Urb1p n=1 Tax=Saccharomycodes ludwigii TaxID=36035 RepID=UPI001E888F55|nr:hypothetical protein SCDLUD_003080 [Saccharomycodes ludwigii]KAH3900113.1 hypothetical protein SCDLUD_003080 [Saccharomycodes ludwigii]
MSETKSIEDDIPFSNPNKRKWKQKISNSSSTSFLSLGDEQLKSLESILKSIRVTNKSDSSIGNDFTPLIEFCSKKLHTQLVQSWSYYATINDHKKVIDHLNKLNKLLEILNLHPALFIYGEQLIQLILTEYMKNLYRGINNMRASLTNPCLNLLKNIVTFQDGKFVDDFLSHFDFSLPTLPKILTPSKNELSDSSVIKEKQYKFTLRYNFILFWISLLDNSPPLLRKDILIDNSKIMSVWFKYMAKVDNDQLIISTIDLLIEKILKEKLFKKSTKCKILNEYTVSKLQPFFYSTNNEIVKKITSFYDIYATNERFGVAFNDNKVWFSNTLSSTGSRAQLGASLEINGKTFKLYNKILYSMLCSFKPWEDDNQCNLVINILLYVPELVAPYTNHLISQCGVHAPKMTSFWFGMTLLLGKIISLPIPDKVKNVETELLPNADIVLDNIMPLSLTKGSLTRCLQNEIPLIKQLGTQLIVFVLQKLTKVVELFDKKNWSMHKSQILNSIYTRLPELSVIVSSLADSYSKYKKNKILLLSYTVTLKYYSKLFPTFFNITLPNDKNPFNDLMNEDGNLKGIEVAILDNYLEFQRLNDSTRWWNTIAKSGRTPFSIFLKLSSYTNTSDKISFKISNLLDNLIQDTQLFDYERLLASPIAALTNSLKLVFNAKDTEQWPKLWKLIDESVSRCVKTPFKYIDLSNDYKRISPFILALMEQWEFVDKSTNYDIICKWLCIFFRNLTFIGESKEGILELVRNRTDIDENLVNLYLSSSEESINKLYELDEYFVNLGTSFYNYVSILPLKRISSLPTRFPVNMLDVAAIFVRIENIATNEKLFINEKGIASAIDMLFEKIGGYALTDECCKKEIVAPKFYNKFCLTKDSVENGNSLDKKAYITCDLVEVFQQLDTYSTEFNTILCGLFENYVTLSQNKYAGKIFQLSLGYLPSELISTEILPKYMEVLNPDDLFIALSKLSKDNVPISHALFIKVIPISSLSVVLCDFIRWNLVKNIVVADALSLALNFDNEPIVKECLKNIDYAGLLNTLQAQIKNESIRIFFASNIPKKYSARPGVKEFLSDTVLESLESFRNNQFVDFNSLLMLFTNNFEVLTDTAKGDILKYILNDCKDKYSSQTVKFVLLINDFHNKDIIIWIHKTMLFVNKHISFLSDIRLITIELNDLLVSLEDLLCVQNVWELVPAAVLNSQLEIFLTKNFGERESVVRYILKLITTAPSNLFDGSKLLQIFVNNVSNPLLKPFNYLPKIRFYNALILKGLFFKDVAKNSSLTVQKSILSFYQGTCSLEDRILYEILEEIESKSSIIWTKNIYSWEFLDSLSDEELELIGSVRLITSQAEGYIISLSKSVVEKSIKNYIPTLPQVPTLNDLNSWDKLESYYDEINILNGSSNMLSEIYDPKFIMLLILNNRELVKKIEADDGDVFYKFEIKRLLNSGLFFFILLSLCSHCAETCKIASIMVQQMLFSMEKHSSNIKEEHIFKLLLTKINYTFFKNKNKSSAEIICPLFWFAICRIARSLLEPKSFMYEIAFRWVLNAPLIRSHDFPLLLELKNYKVGNTRNYENYFKFLSWFLDTLYNGIKTTEDIDFIKRNNLFEWLLNLQNNPYLNNRMNFIINSIICRIQQTDDNSIMVTRNAAISQLESSQYITLLEKRGKWQELHNGRKSVKNYTNYLNLKQDAITNKELAYGYSVLLSSTKRLREWSNDDAENLIKRICL